METKKFGTRLRELRKQASLSQRALANKIGVNFSYLSKIESGVMPPPSEQVILRLAEVLDADKDELMLLAGKIPSDIAQILTNQKALQLLRSDRTQKKIRDRKVIKNTKRERVSTMKKLISYKSLSRIAIPIVLVCAVAGSLWFAAPLPAKALEIGITPPADGTLGSTHSFTITVDIASAELIPIQSVTLEIYKVSDPDTYKVTCANLPLGDGGTASYSSSSGDVSITASSPNDNWGYFSGTGYAYWKGTGYSFGTTFGYGYQTGAARIIYTGTWTSPADWDGGRYEAKVSIVATSATLSKTFIETSDSFTLSAVVEDDDGVIVGGGAGAPPAPAVEEVEPGVWDVSDVVAADGEFEQDVTIDSEDGNVELDINEDTIGKTKEDEPLSEISILEMAEPPAPPADASIVGLPYDLGPDGATFDPEITLTFTYDPDEIPEGVNEEDLVIAIWDEDANEWVELEDCVVDPVTHTITAPVSHFTAFTIIGAMPVEEVAPAAFTVSALSISPTEVNVGESVSISLRVANTGDLSGSYKVTLKINNAVVQTQSVTVAGGASKTVTFTTAQDVAGTYAIDVNGLSDTFTVKTVQAPAAFTVSALSISPTEVNVGESVTISLRVANTGDLSGSYEVTLKINNTTVETKDVTLAGGASQTVTFTTTQDVAGTYTVDVNGLSDTFTVKTVPAGIPWWVWVIVGVVVVVGVLLAYFLWWRRRW